MISYHPKSTPTTDFKASDIKLYGFGFRAADTNEIRRIANAMKSFVWSPIVWKGGIRKEKYFMRADWCVLDFDGPELPLKEAVHILCDQVCIIGTTKSHGITKGTKPPCDRFRVAVRFEEPITDLKVYRYNMWKILKHYPEADASCKDGARLFYPCKDIVFMGEEDGYLETVDKNLPTNFDAPIDLSPYREAGVIPPWVEARLMGVIPEGERNTTIYKMAKDLTKIGMNKAEVKRRILMSRTFENKTPSDMNETEIDRAIQNGVDAAIKEEGSARHGG